MNAFIPFYIIVVLTLRQARRQSSVTVGAKKIFGGTDKFYTNLRERKPKKNSVHPDRLPSVGAQVSLKEGGHIHFPTGRVESNGTDLAFGPQIQG